MKKVLTYFSIKYKGDWEKVYEAIDSKEHINKKYVDDFVSRIDIETVTLVDDNYPKELKQIFKPPFALFIAGNKDLINNDKLFMISLMDIEIMDKKNHFNFSKDLNEILFVVDFNNEGIIRNLIKNNLKFIAISRKGIMNIKNNSLYSDIVLSNNLIISESYDYEGESRNFYFDRLFVGLSRRTLFMNYIEKDKYPLLSVLTNESIPIFSFKEKKANSFKLIKIKSIKDFKRISMLS